MITHRLLSRTAALLVVGAFTVASLMAPEPAVGVPSAIDVERAASPLAGLRPGAERVGLGAERARSESPRWRWPTASAQIAAPFAAPAHAYGAGHRGIDLVAAAGTSVAAPAAGVVAFAGAVAGRGIVTIDQGDGLVTTLEPVVPVAAVGAVVAEGETVGSVGVGGHATAGTLHFGVREDGAYINPLLLYADVPRAVLLPCC